MDHSANDLSIESSDIDMTIKLDCEMTNNLGIDIIQIMAKLVDYITKLSILDSINPIYTASVPVVKLIIDPLKLENDDINQQMNKLKESEVYINYPFGKDELDKIKIDLTFVNSYDNLSNITAKQVEYVRSSLLIYPEIQPLIKPIKRLLQVNKLNNSFNGGLSSFSLFLLVLSYVKMNRFNSPPIANSINLGKLFIEFLLFYSNFFDFNFTIVDVNLDK